MKKPSFVLSSPQTGTDYWVHVRKPRTPGPWIPVIVLDGDDMFTTAVKARDAAKSSAPLLIVGVGYGAPIPKPGNKRARDYTPVQAHEEPSSGGAANFLTFLTATLWPELQKRYTLADDARGLAGYSLGALFVLYAQFQSQPFFTHHLAGSPSIWWGDGTMLEQVTAVHRANPDLRGRLFLSVGENDSHSMRGDLARLETQLGALAFPQLEATVRRFPRKTHMNAMPVTFATGLATLFAQSPAPRQPASGSLRAT
jgi:predicted alpha/beta superfamily hydrolase